LKEGEKTDGGISLEFVLYSFCVNGLSLDEARMITGHYDYLYDIAKASADELSANCGISIDIAKSLLLWLGTNKAIVKKLNTLKTTSIQEKSVNNMIANIVKSKDIPFNRVLNALGIRHIGETASNNLASHFKNIDALMSASFDDLVDVPDIGDQMAQSVIGFFADNRNMAIVSKLREAGLNFVLEEQEALSDSLTDKKFVITGTLSKPREDFKADIIAHGGKVVSSLSAKTDFLLAGEKAGSKLAKAEKLGVTVISESEFYELIK